MPYFSSEQPDDAVQSNVSSAVASSIFSVVARCFIVVVVVFYGLIEMFFLKIFC